MKDVLFATNNPSKLERFRKYYEPIGINIVSPKDTEIELEVEEDGKTPEKNALIKALAYHNASQIPVFAVDYGLRIENFPEEKQPGVNVRRIPGFAERPGDQDLLDYYTEGLKTVGGESEGEWTAAIALVTTGGQTHTANFNRTTVFTSERSNKITPGEPLNSIQIDPDTGKYFSDLNEEEWMEIQQRGESRYIEFMKKHLDKL